MLKISKKDRDAIVSYLQSVIVPASVGANLFNIASLLSKLEEIKEDEPKSEVLPQ